MLIAVYGTLKKGFGNHRLIKDYEPIFTGRVSLPYKMISLGGFPGLIPSEKENDIQMEIYDISEKDYRRVEMLEGYPSFYQKDSFVIIPPNENEERKVEFYILSSDYNHYSLIKDNNFK